MEIKQIQNSQEKVSIEDIGSQKDGNLIQNAIKRGKAENDARERNLEEGIDQFKEMTQKLI